MPKGITHKQISSLGGKATLKKKGKAYFSKLAKKSWAKRRADQKAK